MVCVLTNAVDGPATPLARGIAQLVAAATSEPGTAPLSPAVLARTGRYANLWYVLDLAAVGGRLRALPPTSWTPLDGADELVEDGPDLRITAGNGFGSVGERVRFDAAQPDLMRYAGMSMRRLDKLPDQL